MTNSKLIDEIILSPNHSGLRNEKISKIAIHHAAGVIKGRDLAKIFLPRQRQASSNYIIGSDGKIILGVDKKNRAWTTSSPHGAITVQSQSKLEILQEGQIGKFQISF